jgi:hypothetical protein
MRPLFGVFTIWVIAVACGAAETNWPDPSRLPARPGIPNPLVMFDGSPVKTKAEWEGRRRPELKSLFENYMYGVFPPKPAVTEFHTDAVHRDFLGGKAVLKVVTISFGDPDGPHISMMVITPSQPHAASPTFLAMNFCGNHAIVDDPKIPLSRSWLYSSCAGCTNNRPTESARGSQAKDWPIEQIIDRGYGLATFCSSDVDSDRAEVSDGLYAWLAKKSGASTAPPSADRGTIAAWAWGFHRCVDYLVTDPDIDFKRIAAVGHSRNGKTALLAAAFDERIALCIPHQAGCGGTAPSRGTVGESVKRINTAFPHWFDARFKQFNDNPSLLPIDQNCLIALVAPRPILLGNAAEDQWANPAGQFEMLKAAAPVYELLGAGGTETLAMPENGKLLAGKLGFFIREGNHSMTSGDWGKFLDYADAQWKESKK